MDSPPKRLCGCCKALVVDILSGKTHSNTRWETLQSEHATLSYARGHLDGTIAMLHNSAEHGCHFCRLIVDKVRQLNDMDSAGLYHIFVWGSVPESCELQIAVGDIQAFVLHVSEKPVPKSLVFWSRRTTLHTSPELGDGSQLNVVGHPSLLSLPEPELGTSQAYSQAGKWLKECQSSHKICLRPPSKLPKRVLYLGRDSEELSISLYITGGEIEPYVALSYSWGEKDRFVTTRNPEDPASAAREPRYPMGYILERKTFSHRDKKGKPQFNCLSRWSPVNIPLNVFPQTLKEGIQVAKALGFRYIWIDALCILQGDDYDWAHQGAAMTDIYGNSTMTISATSNEQNNQKILQSLQSDGFKIGGWSEPDGKMNDIFVGNRQEVLDLEEKFLSKRGWVFQERLVSTATLHYTDEGMVWECAHGTRTDRSRSIYSVPWKADWRKMLRKRESDFASEPISCPLQRDMYNIWYDWICAYVERTLYDSRDKFPAVAGIAKKFAPRFVSKDSPLNGSYVAGLWRDDFRAGLLWRRHNRTETLLPLRDRYIAPSWSWGSVQGRLEYRKVIWADSMLKGPDLHVVKIDVLEKHPGTYGELVRGSITVRGYVQKIVVDRQSHPGVRKRPFQECGVAKGFLNNSNVLCTLDVYTPCAPPEIHYHCWCLRIGSHTLRGGREGDVFLLLDRKSESSNIFHRVGFAETDGWWDRLAPTPQSGLLASPCLMELILE